MLVACEFSGIVRDAFLRRGHDAWSCDLLPSESPGPHLQCDVTTVLGREWDLMIAFPPCTHLCSSGAKWWWKKQAEQRLALGFVTALMAAKMPWALENPVGKISTAIRKPDQIIQPWQFGHGETKSTCLWLNRLPPLQPTNVVEGRVPRVHFTPGGKEQWKRRSRTLHGIAEAMADQWGAHAKPA